MTICIKERCRKIILFLMMVSFWHTVIANQLASSNMFSNATIVFQAGGFNATQGDAKHIDINGLIGDQFTVYHNNASNVLLGLGYYLNGLERDQFSLLYGINAFYFAHTTVRGNVIQEQIFTNLSYSYSITHLPVYLSTKVFINTNSDKYAITCDLGIGPNIIKTDNFSERALDGGMTLPDNAFTGQTTLAFSATAGVGIKFNNVMGHLPLEVGYRFFYLGQGSLSKSNNQILNTLKTGDNYANALIFSIYA